MYFCKGTTSFYSRNRKIELFDQQQMIRWKNAQIITKNLAEKNRSITLYIEKYIFQEQLIITAMQTSVNQ